MVGVTSQMSLDDAVKVICDNDSQSGTTEGAESFLITGIQPQQTLPFEYNQGGNRGQSDVTVSTNISLISNFFENFTSDLPDGWTANAGVAGTDFGEETTNIMTGTKSLFFDPAGAANSDLRYNIYSLLEPGMVLSVQLWMLKETGATIRS